MPVIKQCFILIDECVLIRLGYLIKYLKIVFIITVIKNLTKTTDHSIKAV